MKKRMLALLLVLALCACLAPMAFASSEEPVAELEEIVTDEPAAEAAEGTEEEPAESVELAEIELLPAEEGTTSPTLSLVADNSEYDGGATITITIKVNNPDEVDIVGTDIKLSWDEGLTYVASSGKIKSDSDYQGDFTASGDRLITLAFKENGTKVTMGKLSGEIASFQLTASPNADTTYTIKATTDYAGSTDTKLQKLAETSVQVKVKKIEYSAGDVNKDRIINIVDVQRIFAHVTGKNPITDAVALTLANVDGKEGVNIVDVQKLYTIVTTSKVSS